MPENCVMCLYPRAKRLPAFARRLRRRLDRHHSCSNVSEIVGQIIHKAAGRGPGGLATSSSGAPTAMVPDG